jgi:hypothetical protein
MASYMPGGMGRGVQRYSSTGQERYSNTGMVNTAVTQTPQQRLAAMMQARQPTAFQTQVSQSAFNTPNASSGGAWRHNYNATTPSVFGNAAPVAGSLAAFQQNHDQAGLQGYMTRVGGEHDQLKAERQQRIKAAGPFGYKPPMRY